MRSDLFVGAGEASSDVHASKVLQHLRALRPSLSVFGVGGEAVASQGAEIIVPARELSLFGITNLLEQAPQIWKSYRRLVKEIEVRRPRCALLLDMPDLNLKLASRLRAQGTRVVYYISPQVWVWRKYRIHKIRKLVDKMLVVFPFEEAFYRENQVDAEFVGHPLVESIQPRAGYRSQMEMQESPRIALLPGSRSSEIRCHSKKIKETADILRREFPRAEFRLPVPSTLEPEEVRKEAGSGIQVESGGALEIMEWADVALIASGTATLEAALVGTPTTLFYEVTPWNAWLYRNVVRYRGFMGMPNLLLKEEAVREWFQEEASAQNLAAEAVRLLRDEAYRRQQVEKLQRCRSLLGGSGAGERVAERIAEFL